MFADIRKIVIVRVSANRVVFHFIYHILHSYLIVSSVRHHDEQLTLEPFGGPFGYQHVLRPPAAAEVEHLRRRCIVGRPVSVQVPVRHLVRYGYRRLNGLAYDFVFTSVYCVAERDREKKKYKKSIRRSYKYYRYYYMGISMRDILL